MGSSGGGPPGPGGSGVRHAGPVACASRRRGGRGGCVEAFARQARATGAGDRPVTGDPGRFHHRAVRVTDAEQGPVGDHQVHLHRLRLTHLARPDNTCSAVSAATAPTPRPAGPSSGALATDHGPGAGLHRRVRPDHILQRTRRAQVRHPVRRRAHT